MATIRFRIWATEEQGDGGAREKTYNFRYQPDFTQTYVGDHGMRDFPELSSEFRRLAAQHPITAIRRKEISRTPPDGYKSANGQIDRPVKPDEIADDEIYSLFPK